MGTRGPRIGSRGADRREPDGRGARWSRRLSHGLNAAPWLALAIMLALWPTSRRGRQSRIEAALLTHEHDRGREAASPSQIPRRGWSDVLWRTFKAFSDDRITIVAAGITFFTLLSLFPALAAFVSLYGLFADVHDAQRQILDLARVAPRGAVVFLGEQMIRVSAQRGSSLSLTFVLGLLFYVWSANAATKAMINGLNIAYGEQEKRSYVQLTLRSLGFTLGAIAFLAVWMSAIVGLPLVIPFLKDAGPWIGALRWPVLMAVGIATLAAIYRFGPSREHARWRWVSWGSVAAAALWLAVSFAYSWYVANLAHYDRIYGPFGAAAGAIVWLWLSTVVVLFGAELNAEIEHQTAVDSTTGAPLPLGRRGAAMADTVGRRTGPSDVPLIGLAVRLVRRRRPEKVKAPPTVAP